MEWFTHWSIERRVLSGFGLVFAGIVVISAISYRNTAVLIENGRLDTKSHELVQLLGSSGKPSTPLKAAIGAISSPATSRTSGPTGPLSNECQNTFGILGA